MSKNHDNTNKFDLSINKLKEAIVTEIGNVQKKDSTSIENLTLRVEILESENVKNKSKIKRLRITNIVLTVTAMMLIIVLIAFLVLLVKASKEPAYPKHLDEVKSQEINIKGENQQVEIKNQP